MRALLDSSTDPPRFETFLTEDSAGLAAAAICRVFVQRREINRVDSCFFGRGVGLARTLGFTTAPIMFFGQPVGNGCGVLLRDATSIDDGRRILHALMDHIEARADAQHYAIAFHSVIRDDDAALFTVLDERGYCMTETAPTTRLDVHWRDFDGYVKHIRSRSRGAAATVRRESSHNSRSGVVVRTVPPDVSHARALDRLTRAHYRRKNGTEPDYGAEFFPQLIGMLPLDFLISEARRGDQVLGMLGVIRSGDVAWAPWIGAVDPGQRRDFTYFNLVFYHLAAHAAELGIRRIWYGNAAYKAKLLRGCELVSSPIFYRPDTAGGRGLARLYMPIHRAWYRRKFA